LQNIWKKNFPKCHGFSTNTKSSPIQAIMKKINSIPAKTSILNGQQQQQKTVEACWNRGDHRKLDEPTVSILRNT